MIEFLIVVAGSWPIAVMVVGVAAAITIRRSFYQAMNNDHLEKIDRATGNKAVVVNRHPDD